MGSVEVSSTYGKCVEIAADHGDVLIRDSKRPDQQPLRFDTEEFAAFLEGVHNGEYDHLVQLVTFTGRGPMQTVPLPGDEPLPMGAAIPGWKPDPDEEP